MNRPFLYSKNNDIQLKDAMYALEKYFYLIQWKMDTKENVLDVGCADGTVTVDLLYPLLPENLQRLVGVDISLEMIEFAKGQHKNKKISFRQLDISTKQLEADLKEEFDHVFSFHCLHWIQDQRQCTSNLYNMLKPEGDILLIFVVTIPWYQVYENLSKHKFWANYIENVKKFISPYYYSKEPAKELRSLLSQVGFQVNLCEVIDRSYSFKDIFSWNNLVMAMDPVLGKLSDDLKPQFLNDTLNELKKLNCIVKINNQETVHFQYKIFVVYAQKPGNTCSKVSKV